MTPAARVTKIDAGLGAEGALLALAATARHALAEPGHAVARPDRGSWGSGSPAGAPDRSPRAHPRRRCGRRTPGARRGPIGYEVIHPDADPRRDYEAIFDASGDEGLIDALIGRLKKGGEVVLAGFYTAPISFGFTMAFLKEARLRVAAEWNAADMAATKGLIEQGALSHGGPDHPSRRGRRMRRRPTRRPSPIRTA